MTFYQKSCNVAKKKNMGDSVYLFAIGIAYTLFLSNRKSNRVKKYAIDHTTGEVRNLSHKEYEKLKKELRASKNLVFLAVGLALLLLTLSVIFR